MVLELPRQQHALRRPAAEQGLVHALRAHLRQPELVLQIETIEQVTHPTPAQRDEDERAQRQALAEAVIREDPVVQMMEARLDARLQGVRPRDSVRSHDGE